MATLTLVQAASFACQAGFKGSDNSLYNILAIARYESGLSTTAENLDDPNGGSYGILQINGIHFGHGITKEGALDPQTAFNYGYILSKNGTDFSAWSTWKKVTPLIKMRLAEELMHDGVKFLCHIQPN